MIGADDHRGREIPVMSRSVLVALLFLAACTLPPPSSTASLGYPGLERQIVRFYDARAWERNATCTVPEMRRITQVEVVDETEEQVLVRVRYFWRDPTRDGDGAGLVAAPHVGRNRCEGFDERRFTLERVDDGVRVVAMSGPQRPRPIGGG